MQFEAIRGITMGNLRLEVGRQVDDVYCAEWALFGANTTSYAECLGYEGDFRRCVYFDTEATTANNRARFLALLPTFLFTSLVPDHYRSNKCIYLRLALYATGLISIYDPFNAGYSGVAMVAVCFAPCRY